MKFEEIVNLIKTFEVKESFDHYEVYLRRLEIQKILELGEAEINPIPIDGQCNVYQHLAALTRNQELGKYVNVVKKPINIDIYE
jgi:DNA-directed RNA polymerase